MPNTTRSAHARTRALNHYTNGGGTRATGELLLDELISSTSPSNLPAALYYNGFTSERAAESTAENLLSAA